MKEDGSYTDQEFTKKIESMGQILKDDKAREEAEKEKERLREEER